jgi:4a-hydroxytetrahydrobiopterin dehydratase
MRAVLSPSDLTKALTGLPGWSGTTEDIQRSFRFADFRAAMKFANEVAELAEAAQHHPDIDIRYAQVKLVLSTHDAGGVTAKDIDLARQINSLPDVTQQA